MAKKSAKSKKSSKVKNCETSHALCHPSTWLIAVLAAALLAMAGFSTYWFQKTGGKTELEAAQIKVFEHLIDSYINKMDPVADGKIVAQEATGYGISDEDGVLYVTFDFTSCEVAENGELSCDEPRHGIMYFWEDTERDTYSHAFSYPDNSNYHPDGIYVRISRQRR